MLRPPVDLGLNALFFHVVAQGRDKVINILFAVKTALMQQAGNAFVIIRMQITEAVILQLPFQLPDPEAVRQRGINIETLFGGQNALVLTGIFHFAQMGYPLRQLDNHAAEIFHHGEQHTADVIHLHRTGFVVMGGFQLTDSIHIHHTFDQQPDSGTKGFAYLFLSEDLRFGQRKKQRCAQTVEIHTEGG